MKSFLLLTTSVVVSCLLAEVLLRFFTVFPINHHSNQIPHEELVYVLNPASHDIDDNGFRNETRSENQEIFVVGDSHTFGNNVFSDESWPKQLAEILTIPPSDVYNMGVGSYTIYQYYRLSEIAISYKPKHIIIGLYPGNDLNFGVCRVLALPYWQNRVSELGITNETCGQTSKVEDISNINPSFKRFLKENSALISAFDLLIWDRIKYFFATSHSKQEGEFLSISSPLVNLKIHKQRVMAHKLSTDLSIASIREHFSNSKTLFKQLKRRAMMNNVELIVLIIPTKERVFVEWARQNDVEVPSFLTEAYQSEISLTQRYEEFFNSHSILAGDATAQMVELLTFNTTKEIETYPYGNGHPFKAGYRAYAMTASDILLGKIDSTVSNH